MSNLHPDTLRDYLDKNPKIRSRVPEIFLIRIILLKNWLTKNEEIFMFDGKKFPTSLTSSEAKLLNTRFPDGVKFMTTEEYKSGLARHDKAVLGSGIVSIEKDKLNNFRVNIHTFVKSPTT